MGEVRFYHLTVQPLERALPVMLERTLARGQRALIRGTDRARLDHLDGHLWTYDEASFMPHGREGDLDPSRHPIWLTDREGNANGAGTLFLIDGANAGEDEMAAMEVVAILFDGHDEQAVEHARGQWRAATGAGLAAVYWAQSESGGWQEKARSQGVSG